MNGRTIAIGDIHGCSLALARLLETVQPQANDCLITLGDCVDRGPDSCGVIEQLLELREKCRLVNLLGNHEEMMLRHLDGRPPVHDWLPFGGAETLKSYESASPSVLARHVEFIRGWLDYFETDDHVFMHASYDSAMPFEETNWEAWRWHWLHAGMPTPHYSGKTVVVGHTAQKAGNILNAGHLICIDTYCYGNGWLTAIDVNSNMTWQANKLGQVRFDQLANAS